MHEHIRRNLDSLITSVVLNEGWFGWAEFLRESDKIGEILGVNVEPDLAEQPVKISDIVLDQDWPEMCLVMKGKSFEAEKAGQV